MWNDICLEGFCFGEQEDDRYPCGQKYPTPFCLGEGDHCPHFCYTETNNREVSIFVPLRLILKDRLLSWLDYIYWYIRAYTWEELWFNKRKTEAFLNNIKIASAKDCSAIARFENMNKENANDFPEWFTKNSKRYS